jgi:hypothetical protein
MSDDHIGGPVDTADESDGSGTHGTAEVEQNTEPDRAPAIVPDPPVTGEPVVDAAVDGLRALADQPVSEHVAIFDETHRQLQDALADLDEG